MSWEKLLHLGDLPLTLAVASAVTTWLLAAGAWRSAISWSVLYALTIGLVAGSKIAFLGWGTGVPGLGFKAFSGHAAGATAVFPTAFYLLVYRRGLRIRQVAVTAGLALGAAVALTLVIANEHTLAESAAGWLMGATASLASILLARDLPANGSLGRTAFAVLAFAFVAWLTSQVPVGYLMARAALALSGSDQLHRWDSCG